MKKIRFIWVVLLLLCLSACAKEKVSEQGTYGTEESTVDWRGQEFQVQENVVMLFVRKEKYRTQNHIHIRYS